VVGRARTESTRAVPLVSEQFSIVMPNLGFGQNLTATRLLDGRVLLTGGNTEENAQTKIVPSAVLFVPTSNTAPVGASVSVSPVDTTTGTTPIGILFTQVTQQGTATVTSSRSGAPPPAGFTVGVPPTYYEVGTRSLTA
jgi:hypothetical protein